MFYYEKDQIESFIRETEGEKDVTSLFACENSSRIYGYNKPNSDNDVVMVFVDNNKVDPLFKLMWNDVVYINSYNKESLGIGWNLKKTLQLAHKSNATVFEMFGIDRDQQFIYSSTHKQLVDDIRVYIEQFYSMGTLAKSYKAVTLHHLEKDWDNESDLEYKIKKILMATRTLGFLYNIKEYIEEGYTSKLSTTIFEDNLKLVSSKLKTDLLNEVLLLRTKEVGEVVINPNIHTALDELCKRMITLTNFVEKEIEYMGVEFPQQGSMEYLQNIYEKYLTSY